MNRQTPCLCSQEDECPRAGASFQVKMTNNLQISETHRLICLNITFIPLHSQKRLDQRSMAQSIPFIHTKTQSRSSQSLFPGAEGGICLLGLDGPSVSPALRPHCGLIHFRASSNPSFDQILKNNKRGSDFSKSLSWRRRRDLKFCPHVNRGQIK